MKHSAQKPFLLFLIVLLILTQLAIPEGNDDKKTTIQIGKKLSTLDDVRLGDYTLQADDPLVSTAAEELQILLTTLLKFQKKEIPQEIQLKDLIHTAVSTIPALQKNQRNANTLWNAEDQKALDEQIEQHYTELQTMEVPKETHALLSLVHAQYLFTNKKTSEGFTVLQSMIKEYSGTQYEIRARGERVFRLFLAKRYTETQKEAAEILERFPDTREAQDALYFRARSNYQQHYYAESIKDYDHFINTYPTNKWNESAKYFRAKANYSINSENTAIEQFSAFINEYPTSGYKNDARELLGNIYAKQQNFEKAIEMFVLYKKENPEILEQMAADKKIIKFVQPLRAQAIHQRDTLRAKYLDSLYLSFPNTIENYIKQSEGNNIIVAQGYFELTNYYKVSNPEKALEYITKLDNPIYLTNKRSSQPKNKDCKDCDYGLIYRPMLEFQKADILLRLGMVKEFETVKLKLLTLSSTLYAETLINEINSLKERKQYKEADALATTTYHNTSYQPSTRSKALFFLGVISYEQGKIESAKKYFQKVIREFPSENDARVSQILLQRIGLYTK